MVKVAGLNATNMFLKCIHQLLRLPFELHVQVKGLYKLRSRGRLEGPKVGEG